ncbi:hypothetical protein OTB20_00360 [Streptomyces sp. H27-H1]|uniref:hypothetical protein n=1 Tax=Streptomyces sp. H27-H1 TaxID=2996461 RepID=UPI00226FF3DC|nr:hypothetical protein [Streptomyces sp. H27-H1]MCY0924694.1 hypothetical protein [Streptomyces sp. H27-H1]
MRTALRTSIVTAALAAALLAPAATALAAPAHTATAVTSTSAVPAGTPVGTPGSDRYDGEIHQVADGRIAVLRNKSEGPEVWIRAVAPDWKPGDGWAGRVLAKLDATHKRSVIDGIEYDLKKIEDGPHQGRWLLTVRVLGEGAANGTYFLPKATPTTKPSAKPTTKPAVKPAVRPANKPATQTAADTKPQTAVVPKGPVAAGAELATQDSGDSTITTATGAALIAVLAALGATLTIRDRKTRTRG